ncbi:O-antigen translocase [Aquabacterium sp.]|uniref:O-antigen translocase n=1 Tax=Aquabacterium sp. TaxID=1872578 RepID=UPI003BB17994
MSSDNSYGRILKASSIMGGAAGVNLLLGMLRVKFAAMLIGATGVGLNASFGALQGLIGTLAGLGIQSSAVRDIAAAVGKGDQQAIGRAVLTLRRICWLTGLVGMAAMMILSPWLSQLTFGHRDYTLDIAALGLIILFANLSGGQMALIQGMRRIGDMAKANIFGAAAATVAAISFYSTLGLRGIVPALVSVAAIQLTLSWYFARMVPVHHVKLSMRQTLSEARGMVRLGLVMMINGLMSSAVAYITITLITQQEGVQAVGHYSAAYTLSGMFANFVLGAMGADYYPRLAGVAHDKAAMRRMANEQTEIGLLLALPGLLATMALAPWILQLFYSREFLGSATLLQWFILGCLGRVISWPLSYVLLALGKGKWYLLTETSFNAIHVVLIALGLRQFGVEGVAIVFFVMYIGYVFAVYLACRYVIGFAWSAECLKILFVTLPLLAATFLATRVMPLWPASMLGFMFTIVVGIYCLRGLAKRVGPDHRIMRSMARVPGAKLLLFPH